MKTKLKIAINEIPEMQAIKNKLVDISLIVISIVGIPILILAIARDLSLSVSLFWQVNAAIYAYLVIITLFRYRISYEVKSVSIVAATTILGLVNILGVGFSGIAYLWFATAIISTALYFNLIRSIGTLVSIFVAIIVLYKLYLNGIITYPETTSQERFPLINVQIYTLIMILVGLMISFSFSHIHKKIIANYKVLEERKQNLEKTTSELEEEIETRRKSEIQAINNEKNFRDIFEKSSNAILILNKEREILDFNQAFMSLSGYSEKEMLTMHYDQLITEEDSKIFKEFYNDIANFPPRFEIKNETKNGEMKHLDCSSSVISYNDEQALLFIIHDFTEKDRLEKENYLAVISAEEKERTRFSRELHDGLGPLLSTLKIYLEVYFANTNDPEIKERIESTLSESIKSVKDISNNLSPYIIENMGLIKAVDSFVNKVSFGKKIKINFQSNLDHRLKSEVEISIYRYISEQINNTLKHAFASEISIKIEKVDLFLQIHYDDNGIGFDIYDESIFSKGIGLFNIKSRIEKLGGNIKITTSPGNGYVSDANLKFNTISINS
jgi:PAS domain S-box-containing protein